MAASLYRSNFGEWENAPVVQDAVLAAAQAMGSAFLLSDIVQRTGERREYVNRVLGRLHAKGVLTRWKIPVSSHSPGKPGQSATADAAIRQCFLYRFKE